MAKATRTAGTKKTGPRTGSATSAGTRRGATAAATKSYNEESKLKELFVDELKDIYWAEKHLTKALPKLAKAATAPELAEAFQQHLSETENQIGRLEAVFEMLGMAARAKKCEAMEGLVQEAQRSIEETDKGTATRDAALIISAQKAEHYEIASYGSLAQLAKTMGMNDIAELLHETLEEEKRTDERLTQLAESSINIRAEEEEE